MSHFPLRVFVSIPLARTLLALAVTAAVIPLRAQPSGAQVVAGSAVFSGGPGALTITQTSARAIIDWQDFSLAVGESARFVQPDAMSAVLNRVVSSLPSTLAGTLDANGRVYLINPNGILIGAGARIDTAGFLASTLDVADDAFLAGGDLHFRGDSTAAIENLGAINALGGDVFLIARRVENAGSIAAANGTAGLVAASEILLTTGGDERLFVHAASMSGTIINSGTIDAATAELKAAGGNAYALAISNTGVVRATGSAVRNGRVWLVGSGESTVTNSGVLDASSAVGAGGALVVTGARVSLGDSARLDATGATAGGGVFVGGGWQGGDATIRNAEAVVMQAGATIDVSATTSGDGGTAVLWSEDYTAFHGGIAARGGRAGGDGGQVETSSATNLQAIGAVDASAVDGLAGRWLLDPHNVTIASTGASGTGFASSFTPTADSVILASSVATALNGGNDVTITTGATGLAAGDINVNAPITWTTDNTLTLAARNDVRINFDLTATGATAGVVLTPNATGGFNGSFSLNNRAAITLSGATPSLTIAGQVYTIVNSLGVEDDAASAPAMPTLQGLAAVGNLGGRYALGSNIDASETAGWNSGAGFTPIGTGANSFTGTLDGLGHTISGLSITQPAGVNVGLFGYLKGSGVVRNVGLVDAAVLGKTSVGGLVGYNVGAVRMSYVTGSVSGPGGHLFTSDRVGGLVGTNAGAVETSYSSANVSGTTDVGGLVGFNGEDEPGGHNGFDITTVGSIRESYATGDVNGQTSVGGLAGTSDAYFTIESLSTIEYVYATGNVSGITNVGGLVGHNKDTGLSEGYATGTVTGTTQVGGLAGANEQTKPNTDIGIYSSYWNTETTGQTAAVGLENGQTQYSFGRTTAEMTQRDSFPAFGSIATVGGGGARWRIYEGQTTPWLMAFLFPVTVTANSDSKTYDAAAYAGGNGVTYSLPTVNPALDGTLTFSGTSQGAINAGTYAITPGGLFSVQQGYDVIYGSGALVIDKANLTLSGTRVYDGSTLFSGSVLTATGVAGQTFAVTGAGATGNLSTKNVQTNQALATVTGLTLGTSGNGGVAGNYLALATTNSSVSVTPKALTISGFASDDKTYDGSTAAVIANAGTLTGVVDGDTVSFTQTGATFDTKEVGTDKTVTLNGVTLAGSGDEDNYTYTATTTDLSDIIEDTPPPPPQVPLTITADDKSKLYGEALPVFTATFAGFVDGHTAADVTGLQFSTTATIGSNVGTFSITPFGATAPSIYAVGYVPGLLTINPATLTYTATHTSRFVGVANPVFDGTVTGFVNGDSLASATTGAASFDSPASISSPVGIYPINGSGLSANHGNYVFVQAPPNATALTINAQLQVPLTITADDKSKIYGAALPEFTATFAGFIDGHTAADVTGLQFSTTATIGSNVGTFVITPFGATAPSSYVVGYVPGTLTINPALLTVLADDTSRTYGATNPTFTGSFNGFVNGDTASMVSGIQFATAATTASDVGAYAITPSDASAANYILTFVPGVLTISPALLTLTASDAEREFGAANPAFTGTFSGFVNGDTAAVVSGAVFNTPAVATSAIGTYPIFPDGAVAANYTVAFVDGTLRVVAPTVIVGDDPEPVVTVDGHPALTSELAVISIDDRLVLVPVDGQGDVGPSVDEQLVLTLDNAIEPPTFGSAPSTNLPNFGTFELVTTIPGGGPVVGGEGGSSGVLGPPSGDPGLFRESTVSMGGFNVVYHEAVDEAREQSESNAALGSSYREFSDSDNPQLNLVRTKVERKPADSTGGGNAGGAL